MDNHELIITIQKIIIKYTLNSIKIKLIVFGVFENVVLQTMAYTLIRFCKHYIVSTINGNINN